MQDAELTAPGNRGRFFVWGMGFMRVEFERFDFAKGTSTKVVREVDSNEVLKANALFQYLSSVKKPKRDAK